MTVGAGGLFRFAPIFVFTLNEREYGKENKDTLHKEKALDG